jgi:hypothetical protein
MEFCGESLLRQRTQDLEQQLLVLALLLALRAWQLPALMQREQQGTSPLMRHQPRHRGVLLND